MFILTRHNSDTQRLYKTCDINFAWNLNGELRCRFTTNNGVEMDIAADMVARVFNRLFNKGDE